MLEVLGLWTGSEEDAYSKELESRVPLTPAPKGSTFDVFTGKPLKTKVTHDRSVAHKLSVTFDLSCVDCTGEGGVTCADSAGAAIHTPPPTVALPFSSLLLSSLELSDKKVYAP